MLQKHVLSTDELVRSFKDTTYYYDDAGFKARILRNARGLSKRQVNEIARAAIQNPQIYGARSAKAHLRTLFQRRSRAIDSKTRKALKRLYLIDS